MAMSRGLSPVLRAIGEDFEERLPGYHKSRREGLVTLAAVVLETRSANLMELAASLPREIGSKDHRYQYISRLLGNPRAATTSWRPMRGRFSPGYRRQGRPSC